jgi:uncharacterized protein (UPF0548 family)
VGTDLLVRSVFQAANFAAYRFRSDYNLSMFLLQKPTRQQIDQFLKQQANSKYSYFGVGSSIDGKAPAGCTVDRNRIQLGTGPETWEKAVAALRRWEMFKMDWLELCWPTAPIGVGTTVALVISHLRFYSLNASRIVYLIEEDKTIKRFGFAYGTLKDHSEKGEERFLIEWNRDTNQVFYDVFSFSEPGNILVKAAYPIARQLQKKFAQDSLAAMNRAVLPATAPISPPTQVAARPTS